jgi:long-subunit fatty acid transport protein
VRHHAGTGLVLVLLVAWSTPLLAQTSLQVPLQFDFINPGAKSKAMGGAFAGLADDATATFANPAGLLLINRPEVSVELRYSHTTAPFLERGRLSGTIFDQGTDTIQGPVFGESTSADLGVGFLAGVYVPGRRWRVAAYRHELIRVDQSVFSSGVFQKDPAEFTSRRELPQEGLRQVSVTGYGGTVSYRVNPQVSVGASLTAYAFRIDSRFRRFDIVGFLGPPNLDVELGRSTQQGDDVGLAPTVGALFDVRDRVRMGVVYRHGPSFTFTTQDGPDPERHGRFRVPSTLSAGASFQPVRSPTHPVLTVAGEVTRVTYGRLREDFVIDQALFTGREDSFDVQSGTEVHVGVQYWPTLEMGAPQIRAGVWYDPDHSVQFTPLASPTSIADRTFDERLSTALGRGGGLVHYTGGIGFSLTPRLEINAAIDVTSQSHVLSTSMVVR